MAGGEKILELLNDENPQEYKNGIKTEDSVLMTRLPDGDDDHLARNVYAGQVRRTLTELGAGKVSFYKRRKVEIPMTVTELDEGGIPIDVECVVEIPIRSIPANVMERISSEHTALSAKLPMHYNADKDEYEPDRNDPQYLTVARQLVEISAQREIDKFLYGLDMPIVDENGDTVWSNAVGGKQDRKKAVKAIFDTMGMDQATISKIVQAIDAFTEQIDRQDMETFEKK